MLKDDDKKLVLDYLYKQCIVKINAKYSLKKRDAAEIKQKAISMARKELKNMKQKELIKLFKIVSIKEVEKYLTHILKNSLVLNWVNGTPEKRDMRISELVNMKMHNMSQDELVAIHKKLGLTFIK
jgi:predicted XRE-type DNA-binding protein